MSYGTIEHLQREIHPAFEMAVRDCIIRNNPTHKVLGQLKKQTGAKRGVRNALTPEQQQAFLQFMDGHPIYDHWKPIFTFFIGTGVRVGELSGLRWKDVDFENGYITIDHAVIGCQSKPQDIYFALNKIIALHNMALRQRDMNDAFVNLWSVLEVVSKDTEINSKIERVIKSVLPILQNDFFNKYFVSILRDIEHSLTKGEIKQMFSGLEDEDMQQDILYELICLITQPEYEKNRDELFKKLTLYPNIRNKIYKVYKLREHKDQVFDLSVQYAQRLKWHLYRLYRVRNGIVHAGDKSRHIQVLGEHLHIYCDGIIMELIRYNFRKNVQDCSGTT